MDYGDHMDKPQNPPIGKKYHSETEDRVICNGIKFHVLYIKITSDGLKFKRGGNVHSSEQALQKRNLNRWSKDCVWSVVPLHSSVFSNDTNEIKHGSRSGKKCPVGCRGVFCPSVLLSAKSYLDVF